MVTEVNKQTQGRRWWQVGGVLLALLAGSVIFLHWALDDAATKSWRAAEARLKAEGETLDFFAIAPKAVPDEQNFFALAPLKDLALVIDGDEDKGEPAARRKRIEALKLPKSEDVPDQLSGVDLGVAWNAKAWADYYRSCGLPMPPDSGNPGRDLLAGLAASDELFAQLHAGLDRPLSRVTPAMQERSLPARLLAIPMQHLSAVQVLARVGHLRAQACCSSDDWTRATTEIRTMLRLAEGLSHEPLEINALVAITVMRIAMEPTWSLLQTGKAPESLLLDLQRELARIELKDRMLQALRGELAAIVQEADLLDQGLGQTETAFIHFAESPNSPSEYLQALPIIALGKLNPHAGYIGNKASVVNAFLEYAIEPLKTSGFKAMTKEMERFDRDCHSGLVGHGIFGLLPIQSLPSAPSIVVVALLEQTRLDQAKLACALERYYLKRQHYPEHLSELVPGFIEAVPLDVIDAQPMRYARTEQGRYKLWSIGFDGEDDGGKVIAGPGNSPTKPELKQRNYPGDWVWSYERLVPSEEPKSSDDLTPER